MKPNPKLGAYFDGIEDAAQKVRHLWLCVPKFGRKKVTLKIIQVLHDLYYIYIYCIYVRSCDV